jgi:hypothetical protein
VLVEIGVTMTESEVAQPTVLRSVIDGGFDRVLVVRAARAAWREPEWPESPLVAVASAAVVASVPIFVELVLLAADSGLALRTLRAQAWVVALSGFDTLALVLGWRTWTLLSRAGTSIDDLLATCTGRDQLTAWLAAALSARRQLVFAALSAAAALILLGLTQPAIEARLEMGPVSYVTMAWAGLIGGNCFYWLVTLSEFGRRVLGRRDLNLVWHSPSSTPAIAQLSDMFGFLTLVVLIVFVAMELFNYAASRYGSSAVLSVLSDVFPVGFAVAALLAGLMPHFFLYRTVRDARRSTLRALLPLTGDRPPSTPDAAALLHERIELYRLVETSPGLPFSTASMVQFAAAVLGTLLAFFLGQ